MTIANIEMLAVKLTRVFRYQLQFTVSRIKRNEHKLVNHGKHAL